MRGATISLLLVGGLIVGVVPAARAEVTAEQVRVAIDRGADYLKRQQRQDGSWPDSAMYPGGVTALCTLALLNAGAEPEEDCIKRALDFLRRIKPEKTYVVALQTMVFCKATPAKDRLLIARNVSWLEKTQISEGGTRGSWSYPGRTGDNSNSQFALLGLHEAERIGVKVDGRTWRLAKAYWERSQNDNGSWGYTLNPSGRQSGPGTGSMTCAGIASLVITADKIGQSNAEADGDRIRCCVESESDDDGVRRALQWLGRDGVFAVSHNPGPRSAFLLYYLYGLERVGRLTAQRFIGKHDWYREGADHLLQIKGGETSDHWIGVGAFENDERIATSFALLFLSKGRRPVLLSKLKHGPGDDWGRHRSDVANLTRYVESRWQQDLTWQVIDVDAATVEDLLESPVLYLCGGKSPLPQSAAAQETLARKLRGYVDRGGFLFAEGYLTGDEFDKGFRELIKRVFPEPDYQLQPLPPAHPIWRMEEAVDAKYVRPLWGIEFGCRTSVVYAPPDSASGHVRPSLSCLWELSRSGRDQEFSEEVQARVNAGLSIGINVLAYATNRELKFKNPARPERLADRSYNASPRGRISIANLRHLGGCSSAPRALATLLETAQRELNLRASAESRELDITDDALFDYHLVLMHGRNTFHLTDSERRQLRTYLERGGMLFADAICASRSFTESFRREMETILPDNPLRPIPPDDPLLSPVYGGFDLATVTRRDPQRSSRNEPLKDILREVSPELEGIRLGDRWGVIFSRYDVSCALEKHDSLECQGYVRDDAARIGMNVLLYSLQQ